MKRMLTGFMLAVCLVFTMGETGNGCMGTKKDSDDKQREAQEKILEEGTSQVGMPAIKNFREKKLMKEILELRDQTGLTTYVYLFAENSGKLIYLGEAIGFGLPYSAQFTNPQKITTYDNAGHPGWSHFVIAQADPNGLFSPPQADGTWVLMKDPNGGDAKPIYIEPRCIVSPFKLNVN